MGILRDDKRMILLNIALFGLAGIFCRYGIDQFLVGVNASFPFSTLMINILGSFIAGLIFVLTDRGYFPGGLQVGLLVGFCGGFTTFSAYSLQTVLLVERGFVLPALVYLSVSPVLGFCAAYLPVLWMRKFG